MGEGGKQQVTVDRHLMIRVAYRVQRLAGKHLGRDLYSSPAWEMLLDLYMREERGSMSLTSLSGASLAPSRTSLRVIDRLVARKLLIRSRDEGDGRRVNVELSPEAIGLMDRLFDELADLRAPP